MAQGTSRRAFLKEGAGLAALTTLGATPMVARESAPKAPTDLVWDKAVCRFCGVGCGVMVGSKAGKVAAVKGDEAHEGSLGLLCCKGYSLPGILHGRDRLTTPLIRKGGKLVAATWDEALDLVAKRFKETLDKKGPEAVAMYGSGQWTVTDGYAASKWFRAGMGSNHVEANARLCMASAVTGFMTTFGSDEPMGCFEDLDLCDVLVCWGNNMAEAHPVLFNRVLEAKAKSGKKIIDLATRRTPTSEFADAVHLFQPHTDLALANGIAHLLVKQGLVDRAFIEQHVVFKRGKEQIGYGLEDKFKFADEAKKASWDEYVAFLEGYTPDKVAALTGLTVEAITSLAAVFGDPKLKVMSVWCMGVNQHSRGTWMNNLIYNLHLLTGKLCKPGSTAYSLTGQPSACGTVREVGTLAHRLPADMVVVNPDHRAIAAKIWKVPVEKLNPKPGLHTVEMFRAFDRGDIQAMWVQVTNPFVSLPNLNRYRAAAKKGDGRFLVVSDVYPTETTQFADVVLPSAMWIEREALFGNSDRRTQQWNRLVQPPKGCLPDDWQIIEVARRMGYGNLFPEKREGYVEALYEEYRQFTLGTGKDVAAYADLKQARGLRWPVVNGKETRRRYVEGEDPYVKPGEGIRFYKNKADGGRAVIWLRPYEPPAESVDAAYPMWLSTGRQLEHWHTGTMTRRVPQLNRAVSKGYVEVHPEDAAKLGVKDGDSVKVTSRRGTLTLPAQVNGRCKVQKGQVFIPFFDESLLPNLLTLDTYCPISAEPDYKKCAVKLEKA